MKAQIETDARLQAIERRLGEISERQHALAQERTHVLEHATPLRLGVGSPDTAAEVVKSDETVGFGNL